MEYTNTQIRDLIAEHIHSERDRRILYRRLVDGVCYEPLAEEFGLSVSQVKRIIWKNAEIIFRHLKMN